MPVICTVSPATFIEPLSILRDPSVITPMPKRPLPSELIVAAASPVATAASCIGDSPSAASLAIPTFAEGIRTTSSSRRLRSNVGPWGLGFAPFPCPSMAAGGVWVVGTTRGAGPCWDGKPGEHHRRTLTSVERSITASCVIIVGEISTSDRFPSLVISGPRTGVFP